MATNPAPIQGLHHIRSSAPTRRARSTSTRACSACGWSSRRSISTIRAAITSTSATSWASPGRWSPSSSGQHAEGRIRASAARITSRWRSPTATELLQWKRRLTDLGSRASMVRSTATTSRRSTSTTRTARSSRSPRVGPGWTVDEAPDALGEAFREPPAEMIVANRDEARIAAETWPEPVPAITPAMALQRDAPHHRHRLRHPAHRRLLRWAARYAARQDDEQLRRSQLGALVLGCRRRPPRHDDHLL